MESQIDIIKQKQAERLELIRDHLRMTQKEFAVFLEILPGSYSDIKRNRVGISKNIIRKLEVKLKINVNWLLDGSGEMLMPASLLSQTSGSSLLKDQNKANGIDSKIIDKLSYLFEQQEIQQEIYFSKQSHQIERLEKLMKSISETQLNIKGSLIESWSESQTNLKNILIKNQATLKKSEDQILKSSAFLKEHINDLYQLKIELLNKSREIEITKKHNTKRKVG